VANVLDQWRRRRDGKARERAHEAVLVEHIERVVQDCDPAIRQLAGYRQQLSGPVASALRYMERLIASIPGPIRLSHGFWGQDPLIHALFVSPEDVRSFLRQCAALKAFFRKSGVETAIGLLTATKRERTVFGTALDGEILRRDVPQIAVEFHDHRVVAPVATEPESRRELVHRGLHVLATHAHEEILEVQALREELTAQRNILAAKLKILETRQRRVESLLGGGSGGRTDAEEAQQLVADIDGQLLGLGPGSGTSRDFVNKLEKVLAEASQFLTEKTIAMRLNTMGMKVDDQAAADGREIVLAELEIPGRARRVAVLAQVAARDCLNT
jgi:hypothetical protein